MKTPQFLLALLIISGLSLSAQAQDDKEKSKEAVLQNTIRRGTFPVELTRVLDVGKTRVGEEVVVLLEQDLLRDGNVFVPVGAKVVGHVTEVKQSTKDDPESRLQVVFEKVVVKDGREIAFTSVAIIQALAPDKQAVPKRRTAGNLDRGPLVVMPDDADSKSFQPAIRGTQRVSGAKILTPNAHGVIYLEGLELKDGPEGPVIVARGKNVKLDYGTQFEITIK